MKNFMRLITGVNTTLLLLAIHRLEKSKGIWRDDTHIRKYPQGPKGDVESIILRFPTSSNSETEKAINVGIENFDQHENNDLPAFKDLPEARKYIFDLMAFVSGERLGRCVINKIRPGGVISSHADEKIHAEYWDRFHIVLKSGSGCNFRCGDEQVTMSEGEVWWFNNLIEHEVINNSAEERIHLIVDIRTSK